MLTQSMPCHPDAPPQARAYDGLIASALPLGPYVMSLQKARPPRTAQRLRFLRIPWIHSCQADPDTQPWVCQTTSHYKHLNLTPSPTTSFRLCPTSGQASSESSRRSLLASRLQFFSVRPEASTPSTLHHSQSSSETHGSAHGLEATMNGSAVTNAGHWNLPILAARCSQDWKIQRCPLVLMFDLIRSAAKLFLIGSAGALLGVAGFILSILAYIKQAMDSRRPRRLGISALSIPDSTSPSRDRDLRTRNTRVPQTPHDRSKGPSGRSRSPTSPPTPKARSGPRTIMTSSHSSQGPETSSPEEFEEQRPGPSSRRRSQGSLCGMKSIGDAIAPNPIVPVLRGVTSEVTTTVSPWTPRRSLSDVSSSELLARRLSLDGHLSISGRRVLMKIKDSHSNLRERCLSRVQSMPPRKSSARPLRTDPYQAPYFFPSPMSPEAATYIQEVVNERQGTRLPSTMNSVVAESNPLNAVPDPSLTRVNQESETVALPSSHPPSPTPSLPIAKSETPPSTRRHRWSLHLPHLPPHHHASNGSRLMDEHAQEKGITVHKELFSKFKFGHHRRRHRIGSADSHATVSSAAS